MFLMGGNKKEKKKKSNNFNLRNFKTHGDNLKFLKRRCLKYSNLQLSINLYYSVENSIICNN